MALSRYKTILGMLYACGEYDRLVQGVFENYLDMVNLTYFGPQSNFA